MRELQDINNISDEEYKKLILEKYLPWIIRYTIALPSIYSIWKRRFDNTLNDKYEEFKETSLQEGINSCLVVASGVGQRSLVNFMGIGNLDDNGYFQPHKPHEKKHEQFITDLGLPVLSPRVLKNPVKENLEKSYKAINQLAHFNWEKSNEQNDSTQIICDASLEVVKLIKIHVYDALKRDFQEATKLTHKELALIGEEL